LAVTKKASIFFDTRVVSSWRAPEQIAPARGVITDGLANCGPARREVTPGIRASQRADESGK
jgi:hypothetical protein